MKLISKDGSIVEGEPISEGLAKFLQDAENGTIGISVYSHQRRALAAYIIANFELTLKAKPVHEDTENSGIEVIFPSAVAPLDYPEASKSLPLVETSDDPMF